MRTRKVILNSISFALLQIVTLATGLVLPRLYILVYGSTMNGLVLSTTQFISYFQYIEAGLAYSLMFALYRPLAEKNVSDINVVVSTARKSYLKVSGIYFALVLLFTFLFPFSIHGQGISFFTKAALFFVVGTLGALDMYTIAKYRVLLVADQKEYVISLISVLAIIVKFIVVYSLVSAGTNIIIVQLVPALSFFIRSLVLHYYTKKNYPFIDFSKIPDSSLTKMRWDAMILQLSVSLNLSLPIVIVSIMCSLKLASVFSIYSMVMSGLIGMLAVFTSGMSPLFGNVLSGGDSTSIKRIKDHYECLLYTILAFLSSCALILTTPFVTYYTRGITDAAYVNPVYTVLFIIWFVWHDSRIPHTTFINAAGLYKETRRVNVMQLALLLLLSITLSYYFEIIGVLVAMIVAAFYRSVDMIMMVQGSVLKQSVMPTFLRLVRIFVIIAVAYIPFLLHFRVIATSLSEWAFWTLGVAIWCGSVTFAVNFIFERNIYRTLLENILLLVKDRSSRQQQI